MALIADNEQFISKTQNDSPEFVNLPNEMLSHISKFCTWKSRRSLAQVCSRFNTIFGPACNRLKSITLRGSVMVDFYMIDIQADDEVKIRFEAKYWGTQRTVTRSIQNINESEEHDWSTRSIAVPTKTYVSGLLRQILKKFSFEAMHIGERGFHEDFLTYSGLHITKLAVSNIPEELQLAYRFQPHELIINTSDRLPQAEATFLDIAKIPHLRQLHLNASHVDIETLLASKLTMLVSNSDDMKVTWTTIERVMSMFQSGKTSLKFIKTFLPSEPPPKKLPKSCHNQLCHVINPQGRNAFLTRVDNHLIFTTRP